MFSFNSGWILYITADHISCNILLVSAVILLIHLFICSSCHMTQSPVLFQFYHMSHYIFQFSLLLYPRVGFPNQRLNQHCSLQAILMAYFIRILSFRSIWRCFHILSFFNSWAYIYFWTHFSAVQKLHVWNALIHFYSIVSASIVITWTKIMHSPIMFR